MKQRENVSDLYYIMLVVGVVGVVGFVVMAVGAILGA
jgi:hypothetical protein